MRLKNVLLFAFLLLRFPVQAQVPLGGHAYVPSSSDSTNGMVIVTWNVDATCTLTAPSPNCALTYLSGGTPGSDGPYVGTLYVYDNVGISPDDQIIVPLSPGRFYFVNNTADVPIVIGGTTGATVTVNPNSTSLVWSDGIDYHGPSLAANALVNNVSADVLFPSPSTLFVGSGVSDAKLGINTGSVVGNGVLWMEGDSGNVESDYLYHESPGTAIPMKRIVLCFSKIRKSIPS